MKELETIYEAWCEFQTDNSELVKRWCEADEYLYANCSDEVREVIEDFLLGYAMQRERQAFIAGYQKAFKLWSEIIRGD